LTDITFVAEVAKVQTLADGGIRLTLDLGESDTMQMAQLAMCQQFGVLLSVICKTEGKQNYATLPEGRKRKSEWATEEKAGAHTGA